MESCSKGIADQHIPGIPMADDPQQYRQQQYRQQVGENERRRIWEQITKLDTAMFREDDGPSVVRQLDDLGRRITVLESARQSNWGIGKTLFIELVKWGGGLILGFLLGKGFKL